MSHAARYAALVVAFAAALSCSGPRGGMPRESPAPEFNYITEEQLESAMWQLASGVESLQAIFGSRKPVKQSQRVEVVGILDQMIAAATELGPSGMSTNHPRITHNLGRFREKLEIARDSASMNPPRYYLVGNLSGTCLACHGSQ
jgi:hypothetical protein